MSAVPPSLQAQQMKPSLKAVEEIGPVQTCFQKRREVVVVVGGGGGGGGGGR